jgi:hypothetical protein
MVRLPNVCNHNPETTVLAHYRLVGISGMGMKSPDLIGAWACSDCHAHIDRSTSNKLFDVPTLKLYHLEGMARTINELIKLGVIE